MLQPLQFLKIRKSWWHWGHFEIQDGCPTFHFQALNENLLISAALNVSNVFSCCRKMFPHEMGLASLCKDYSQRNDSCWLETDEFLFVKEEISWGDTVGFDSLVAEWSFNAEPWIYAKRGQRDDYLGHFVRALFLRQPIVMQKSSTRQIRIGRACELHARPSATAATAALTHSRNYN